MIRPKLRVSSADALQWLTECDEKFCPPKWPMSRLEGYAEKLSARAYWMLMENEGKKMAFIAYYLNDESQAAYISIIAVAKEHRGCGCGKQLLKQFVEKIPATYKFVYLEVSKTNISAMNLYQSFGFEEIEEHGDKILMQKKLL